MSTILITGAAQRVGLHVARRLAEQGHEVVVSYKSPRPGLLELENLGVTTIFADFSTTEGIQRFISEIEQRFRSLRAVIHNASVWGRDGDMDDQASLFDVMYHVHMKAPYLLNLAFTKLLMAHHGPRDIIHMSDYTVQKGSDKHAAYIATKAGLESMTRSFAAMLAPAVQVNTIAPGLIMFNQDDDEAYKAKALTKSALGIEPGPEVIFQAVEFLLNNAYTTGICLPVDGGRNVK